MRSRRFSQIDVFSTEPWGGNPLAIVHDPDDLDTATMQRFASWTNLSETTFLLPPQDSRADYRVRIFTPTQELPFAGHPTLGSCHAWLETGGQPRNEELIQECAAGLIRLRRAEHGLAFAAPPMRRTGPVDDHDLAGIAASINLDPHDVVDAQWLINGPEWVVLLLASAAAVVAVRPGQVSHDIGIVGPCPVDAPEAIEVRAFFAVPGGTAEDPVTGSLNAAIAEWLVRSGRLTAPYVARQGTVLGRSGRVHISQADDGSLWTGGATATRMRGHVDL